MPCQGSRRVHLALVLSWISTSELSPARVDDVVFDARGAEVAPAGPGLDRCELSLRPWDDEWRAWRSGDRHLHEPGDRPRRRDGPAECFLERRGGTRSGSAGKQQTARGESRGVIRTCALPTCSASSLAAVHRHISRRVGRDAADDIAAATFAAAYADWSRFDPARPVRPWLYDMANLLRYRRDEERQAASVRAHGRDPVSGGDESEVVHRLDAVSSNARSPSRLPICGRRSVRSCSSTGGRSSATRRLRPRCRSLEPSSRPPDARTPTEPTRGDR